MKYTYRILDSAAAELLEAALWYENKRTGLGDELILCFEAKLHQVLSNPLQFQVRDKDCRFAIVDRFPYYIIYLVEGDLVSVVSCFHAKRNPRIWKRRVR